MAWIPPQGGRSHGAEGCTQAQNPCLPREGTPHDWGWEDLSPLFFGGGMIRNFEIRYRKAFKIYTKHLVL